MADVCTCTDGTSPLYLAVRPIPFTSSLRRYLMITPARKSTAQITLARALSKLGAASRSEARGIIAEGRVAVNKQVVRNPDLWIDPRNEHISLDGVPLLKPAFQYIAMHKPVECVTTRSDEHGRKTVYHYLPDDLKKLVPVGRLDKDTTGLLLFTNDTRWGDMVTGQGVPKVYMVRLNAPLLQHDCRALESGMVLEDGTQLLPARVVLHTGDLTKCKITITEGKNRQVRRMFEALGYAVESLHRISIGPVRLGPLPAGKTRAISREELIAFPSHTTTRSHARHRKPHR